LDKENLLHVQKALTNCCPSERSRLVLLQALIGKAMQSYKKLATFEEDDVLQRKKINTNHAESFQIRKF